MNVSFERKLPRLNKMVKIPFSSQLASPLPKEASVLIVEQSGAIRKLPVQAATTNPDVKTPSANSGELLQQTAVLTAAAFRHSTGRLLVGTKDGRLVSVLVPYKSGKLPVR